MLAEKKLCAHSSDNRLALYLSALIEYITIVYHFYVHVFSGICLDIGIHQYHAIARERKRVADVLP